MMQKLIGGILATSSLAFEQHPLLSAETSGADVIVTEHGSTHKAVKAPADPHRYAEMRENKSFSVRSSYQSYIY